MKMLEALSIIDGKDDNKGFMVAFDRAGDGFLRSDYFPDLHAGEELIKTESEAWELASKFAAKTYAKCVNIYVVNSKFKPVASWKEKQIVNR